MSNTDEFGKTNIAGEDQEQKEKPENKMICQACSNDSFRVYTIQLTNCKVFCEDFYCTQCNTAYTNAF
jgi:hypothetical protein